MDKALQSLSHALAGLLMAFISLFSVHQPTTLVATTSATSTAKTQTIASATTTTTQNITKKPTPKTEQIVQKTQTVASTGTAPTIPPPSSPEAAIVNILCISSQENAVRSITGSGVMIDPRGVVLTSAHIGQYFLLQDLVQPPLVDCTVRTGDPATASYKATLLYLPPLWIQGNSLAITGIDSLGTGEHDYTLLLISRLVDGTKPFPQNFPYIPIAKNEIETIGEQVTMAGYPAEFLSGNSVEANLMSMLASTTIDQISSFSGNSFDLLSLAGNPAAQHGSSGGPIIDPQGQVIAITSTITDASTTAARIVNATTIGHVNRSMIAQTGSNLSDFLTGSIYDKAQQFDQILAPNMTAVLLRSLGYTPKN